MHVVSVLLGSKSHDPCMRICKCAGTNSSYLCGLPHGCSHLLPPAGGTKAACAVGRDAGFGVVGNTAAKQEVVMVAAEEVNEWGCGLIGSHTDDQM